MGIAASVTRTALALAAAAVTACSGASQPEALPPLVPQVSGTLAIEGLSLPVSVTRDRWGVPHIEAATEDDLFLAQGFVQAQDRLFQMDLWRRSVQGRLSEVLGSNFIERDAMTRRMQYRGDLDSEWESYGPGTRTILAAFTRGINAWVRLAREHRPEEFVLAGWSPELWEPEDLLNRTDAFVESADAQDEVFRAQLVAALGPAAADNLLPLEGGARTVVPSGLDPAIVSPVAAHALRRVGTTPFFRGLAESVGGSNAWAVAPTRSETGRPILAGDPHRVLANPSSRYLVHLKAPGWNVIGATAPWLPGVAIGHNGRIAWSMTAARADTQDLYLERVNPDNPSQVWEGGRWVDMAVHEETIVVKGSAKPFTYEEQRTPRGVVIAVDRDRGLAYVLRWSGSEAGAASELGALAIDRAGSWAEFRAALARWKMPAAEFVYADAEGHVGRQLAALVPIRRGWNGALPATAWSGEYEWRGWITPDRLPHAFDPATGHVVSANDSRARLDRISASLSAQSTSSIETFTRLQHDVVAQEAGQIVPLLESLRSERADVEKARQRLVGWDRRLAVESTEATLYADWRRHLLRRLVAFRVPAALAPEFVVRGWQRLAPAVVRPSRVWFDGDVSRARNDLLLAALGDAVDEGLKRSGPAGGDTPWGSLNRVLFAHPLAVTSAARSRFNVGPFSMPGHGDTVLSLSGMSPERMVGPSFRLIVDLADWDRSVATQTPGQSGSPDSTHFNDLAASWAAGEYFPLSFTPDAVRAHGKSTLTLTPPEGER